jgi:DNA-binding GntR family transcriptional regulator
VPNLDGDALDRMRAAADECSRAGAVADVGRELAANRRFHSALLEPAAKPHLLRMIRMLWDSTEAYRALYYNLPLERKAADRAHARILRAANDRDADRLVRELDLHRTRALETLRRILS